MPTAGPITTIRENCRKCYACVRNCPVKAIRVCRDHAEVIAERCVGCGKCVQVCSQKARVMTDGIGPCRRLLDGPVKPVAVLGCSYPAFFHDIRSGQLANALKHLGFAEVHEGTAGVDLLHDSYRRAIESGGNRAPLINSHCPSVVALIERHYPQLLKNLAGIVSPMVASGRFIKQRSGQNTPVVYISACFAGRFEIENEEIAGAIDCVVTYRELSSMLRGAGIDPRRLAEIPFDGRRPETGRLFAIPGGPFRAFGIRDNLLDPEYLATDGEQNVLEVIHDLAAGHISPRVVDIRFCNGACLGGPGRNNRLTTFNKRRMIIDRQQNQSVLYLTHPAYRDNFPLPDFTRTFSNQHRTQETPSGERIRQILQATDKFEARDELNCGACGYATCREHAVAVYRGLAEADMCLPHNLKRLEEDRVNLTQKYELAQRALAEQFGDADIVGQDSRTQGVLRLIRQVAPTPTTVLIRGESGTGKELTARAIHAQSQRADKPLVTVNCTTLTDSLLESELFGHKKGAFTGALADKRGLFEAANGGTIFLDEIGDITPKLQAELLRVLDSGETRPVGGTATVGVDVRLIAATNRNLEQGVREGWFREDLFYRLNVFTITMPPLRSRLESLTELLQVFIARASKRVNKTLVGIEERAVHAMRQYPWPGNIRELQNIIERAAVLTHDEVIHLDNLPVIFADLAMQTPDDTAPGSFRGQRQKHLTQVEKNLLVRYLRETGGNVTAAARRAGIPRRTFYRLLERYQLQGNDFKL